MLIPVDVRHAKTYLIGLQWNLILEKCSPILDISFSASSSKLERNGLLQWYSKQERNTNFPTDSSLSRLNMQCTHKMCL